MKRILISIIFTALGLAQYDFNLADINPSSPTYGQDIGPQTFPGIPTLYYFGHQYWGTCRSRFESLHTLFEGYNDQYSEFNIIGVGKNEYSNSNNNFTNNTDLPLVVDSATWINWDTDQRDLVFLDKNGNFFCNINITSGFDEQDILDKIYHLHWNTTANLDIEVDLDDSDNIFIPGSIHPLNISIINNSFFNAQYAGYLLSSNSTNIQFSHTSNWFYVVLEGEVGFDTTNLIISENVLVGDEIIIYAEPSHINECSECSECDINCLECHAGGSSQISFIIGQNQLIGDINLDNSINVVDIVIIVDLILNEGNYNGLADINNDGQINIVDIVQLVNLILS